ncbi:MAG: hypothetical protein Sapg2KO_21470 [Saprospiraceae bacterium]
MDINIFRSQTGQLQQSFTQLLTQLPKSLHARALRYKSEQSALNYVIGRLLLKRGLEFFGLDNDLEQMEFQKNGKPVLAEIHFNIAHTDQEVICGFSKEGSLGLDLEKIKPIEFENFTALFSQKEWTIIKSAADPIRTFYWFWTRKEAIIKALGRSLNFLHQIELDASSDQFITDGKPWFLRDMIAEQNFVGAVCCEAPIGKLVQHDLNF